MAMRAVPAGRAIRARGTGTMAEPASEVMYPVKNNRKFRSPSTPRRPAWCLPPVLATSGCRRAGGHGKQDGADADPDGPGGPRRLGLAVQADAGGAHGVDGLGPLSGA